MPPKVRIPSMRPPVPSAPPAEPTRKRTRSQVRSSMEEENNSNENFRTGKRAKKEVNKTVFDEDPDYTYRSSQEEEEHDSSGSGPVSFDEVEEEEISSSSSSVSKEKPSRRKIPLTLTTDTKRDNGTKKSSFNDVRRFSLTNHIHDAPLTHVFVSPGDPKTGSLHFYGFDVESTEYGNRIVKYITNEEDKTKNLFFGYVLWKSLHPDDDLMLQEKQEFTFACAERFGKELTYAELGTWVELSEDEVSNHFGYKLFAVRDWSWTRLF